VLIKVFPLQQEFANDVHDAHSSARDTLQCRWVTLGESLEPNDGVRRAGNRRGDETPCPMPGLERKKSALAA
jgi:hypothetical protein